MEQPVQEYRENFYQCLADLIRTFWEFHKNRLESGDVPFACVATKRPGQSANTEFVLQQFLEIHSAHHQPPFPVIDFFTNAVFLSLKDSWHQFSKAISGEDHGLLERASELGKQASQQMSGSSFDLDQVVVNGLATGVVLTTQLVALSHGMGKPFSAQRAAVVISKIAMKNLGIAHQGIDRRRSIRELYAGWARRSPQDLGLCSGQRKVPPPYFLLNPNSYTGLDLNQLKMLGLGGTTGCPASLAASKSAEVFLETRVGASSRNGTTLEEFTETLQRHYEKCVVRWYETLSFKEKHVLIHSAQLEILDGRIPGWNRNTGAAFHRR